MNRVKWVINFFTLLGLFMIPFNLTLATDTNYRFTGQELDKETGIYDYGARNYNPNTGRFLQKDPVLKDGSIDPFFLNNATKEELNEFLSNPQKLNEYSYVLNNPVKYVDPTGETEVWALKNPLNTARHVSFWLGVSKNYLKPNGWNIASAFLNHSLKLNMGNLDMNIGESKDPNNVINAIKQSDDYKNFIQDKMQKAKESGEAHINYNGGVGTGKDSLVFNSGDLKYSFQKITNISINGKMLDNGTWELNVKLNDTYDYAFTPELNEYKGELKATVGANVATVSQTQGVISNYNINVEFNDTW